MSRHLVVILFAAGGSFYLLSILLKPFSQARFDQAVAHAAQRIERILIRDRGQLHIVPVASVDQVEAQDDYIRIHADGKSYMKTQRLSELEAQLDPEQFVRMHRSFLINAAKLQSIEGIAKSGHLALLRNGTQVPISRAGYERLKRFLES